MEIRNVTAQGIPVLIRKTLKFAILLMLGGMVFYSCSSSSTGTNGDDDGGGGNGNGDPQPTYTNVQQIFNGNCGGSDCHIGQTQSGVRLDSYSNTMNSVGVQYGEAVVQAGDAAGSPLVDKIEAGPEFGDRMPLNGSPLSSSQIDLIKTWINNGAENN